MSELLSVSELSEGGGNDSGLEGGVDGGGAALPSMGSLQPGPKFVRHQDGSI